MRIRNQQQQPVKRKGKGITVILLLLVVLFVGGAGGYIYMKGNPFAKETVDVKEKTSPEEALSKFVGAAAKIGDNEPTLAAMFGDTTTQNKKTRLQACLDAKHYIEDRVYESTTCIYCVAFLYVVNLIVGLTLSQILRCYNN